MPVTSSDYKISSILDYKRVVCNYDWLITIDKNDSIMEYNNWYDPRAKMEMEEVALITPVKKLGRNTFN